MISKILNHNRESVANEAYKPYITSKYPDMRIAIVTCMDTRLVELLPAVMGIRNGDCKIIKTAGGLITDPMDSCMRSLLVAVYELGVNEIMIIGHTGCGVQGMDPEEMFRLMQERGISRKTIDDLINCGVDLKGWLTGFEETEKAVLDSVDLVRRHPLMPADVNVGGYVMDTVTGELKPL